MLSVPWLSRERNSLEEWSHFDKKIKRIKDGGIRKSVERSIEHKNT